MRISRLWYWLFGVGCSMLVGASVLAARFGGDAELAYESMNAGGAAFATNADARLGGSFGQGNLVSVTTNAAGQMILNGFWKAEDGCTLYNPVIVNMQRGTGGMGLTFLVINSNTYSVTYVDNEDGGLILGQHAITNVAVAPFTGEGSAGSTTTVWHNVAGSTNVAKYYIIRCE